MFFKIVVVVHPAENLDEEKLRRSLNTFSNQVLLIIKFATPRSAAAAKSGRSLYVKIRPKLGTPQTKTSIIGRDVAHLAGSAMNVDLIRFA